MFRNNTGSIVYSALIALLLFGVGMLSTGCPGGQMRYDNTTTDGTGGSGGGGGGGGGGGNGGTPSPTQLITIASTLIVDGSTGVSTTGALKIQLGDSITDSSDRKKVEDSVSVTCGSDPAPKEVVSSNWNSDYTEYEMQLAFLPYYTQCSISMKEVTLSDGDTIQAKSAAFWTEKNPDAISSDGQYATMVFGNNTAGYLLYGNQICPPPTSPEKLFTLEDVVPLWSYDPQPNGAIFSGMEYQGNINIGGGRFGLLEEDWMSEETLFLYWKALASAPSTVFTTASHQLEKVFLIDFMTDKYLFFQEYPDLDDVSIFHMVKVRDDFSPLMNLPDDSDLSFDIPLGQGMLAMTGTDLDGDGLSDFVVTRSDPVEFDVSYDVVQIFFGKDYSSLTGMEEEPPTSNLEFHGPLYPVDLKKGDFNGDGIGDLLIVLNDTDVWEEPAQIWILLGKRIAWPNVISSSVVDVVITCDSIDTACALMTKDGESVTVLDKNRDGFDDVLIGAPEDGDGIVYAVYGSRDISSRFPKYYDSSTNLLVTPLSDIWDEAYLPALGDESFGMPTAVGDINNDGYPDFLTVSRSFFFDMHVNFFPGGEKVVRDYRPVFGVESACSILSLRRMIMEEF